MVWYEFMKHNVLCNETMSTTVKELFGIEINAESLYQKDFLSESLKKILKEKINKVSGLDEILDGYDETEEIICLKKVVSEIEKLICDFNTYEIDLIADTYMGILLVDERSRISFGKIVNEWEKGACNKSIDIDNARRHYPYFAYYDFYEEGIPGGCIEYHRLMSEQSNIGIFDIGAETKSLKKYAFPKTYKIYNGLRNATIENFLLLENTQGVGYTNQIFHYTKNITDKKELDKLKKIILSGLEIHPIFFRKEVVEKMWNYLVRFNYSKTCIEYVLDIMEEISYAIEIIYKDLLKFYWNVCYLAFKKDDKDDILYSMQLYLKDCWKEYYKDDEVYVDWIKNENLHDWRGIETVDDCFYYIGDDGGSFFDKIQGFENKLLRTSAGKEYVINVKRPLNELGKTIQEEALEKLASRIEMPETIEELTELYYKTLYEIFNEIQKKEAKIWFDKEPKLATSRLKSLHIYAIIHAEVVNELNLIEE